MSEKSPLTKVTALLTCESADPDNVGGRSVQLRAMYTGNPEDSTYARYTPNALFAMTVNNPNVTGIYDDGTVQPANSFFKPGERYRITIERDYAAEEKIAKENTEKAKAQVKEEANKVTAETKDPTLPDTSANRKIDGKENK